MFEQIEAGYLEHCDDEKRHTGPHGCDELQIWWYDGGHKETNNPCIYTPYDLVKKKKGKENYQWIIIWWLNEEKSKDADTI